MRGRKPKATVLHLLTGTQRARSARPDEPQPVGDLVAPPEYFSDAQRTEWVYALEHAPRGLLRRLDRNIFAQWCIVSVELVEHEIAIRTEGRVIELGGAQRITVDKDGNKTTSVRSPIKRNNPRVGQMRDARLMMVKLTSELGFSPTSRSRITLAGGGKKEANRFSNNAANKSRA